MDRLHNYDIEFTGLKTGRHEFRFEIGEAFFQLFDTEQEFTNPKIIADVLLDKHTTFMEIFIKTHGTVQLVCDITSEPFEHAIENEIKILVKQGETYDDSNEEVITIPHQDHAFNIAQLVYEDVMLSVPMKKISPDVTEEDLELLERFSPPLLAEEEEEQTDHEADPRWDALKKLKDKN